MKDTQLAVREFRSNQWMQIIQDRNQSGLTIREYCEQNGLSRNAYYYWLRIIRQQAMEERETSSRPQEFVEIPSLQVPEKPASQALCDPAAQVDPGTGLTLEYKGVRIQVQTSTSMQLLSKALGVVSHAI